MVYDDTILFSVTTLQESFLDVTNTGLLSSYS